MRKKLDNYTIEKHDIQLKILKLNILDGDMMLITRALSHHVISCQL